MKKIKKILDKKMENVYNISVRKKNTKKGKKEDEEEWKDN